jgi:hypothetical protein
MTNEENISERHTRLLNYLGDESAVEFIELVFDIVDMWDALIDKDEVIEDQTIHNTFMRCLVDLPANSFYQKNFAVLAPQIMLAVNSWLDANELQKGDEQDRISAYGLRFVWAQLISTSVSLIKGGSAARAISPEIWRSIASEDNAPEWVKGGAK